LQISLAKIKFLLGKTPNLAQYQCLMKSPPWFSPAVRGVAVFILAENQGAMRIGIFPGK
jgi:hypothetical protein